jgi:predicted Na+-dependent transporter
MLCMGISLQPADFRRVAQRPGAVLLALAGCYGLVRITIVATVPCVFVP